MKLKRQHKVILGRKTRESDRKLMDYAINFFNIDTFAGIGYKGLIKSGERKPRPYHCNSTLDYLSKEHPHTNLAPPLKVFAGHFDHKIGPDDKPVNVAFFHSDVNQKGFVFLNADADNKSKMDRDKFKEIQDAVLAKAGLTGCYVTQRSTNFWGYHNPIKVSHSVENINDFETNQAMRQYIRETGLALQKYLNQVSLEMGYAQDIIHWDVLGLPTLYNEDSTIHTRGNWHKLPRSLNLRSVRDMFRSLPLTPIEDLERLCKQNEASIVKPVKPLTITNTGASNFSQPTWDLRDGLVLRFTQILNSDCIRFGKGRLSASECVDYVMAFELSSDINSKAKKPEHLQGTNPMKACKALYQYHRDNGLNLQDNAWDHQKACYVRNLLEAYKVVQMQDRTFSVSTLDEETGEYVGGRSMKWTICKQQLKQFTNPSEDQQTYSCTECVQVGSMPLDKIYKVFVANRNIFLRIIDFEPDLVLT